MSTARSGSKTTKPREWGGVYRSLGIKPVINAMGSVTLLGGSTVTPSVRAAMSEADDAFVPLEELQEKAGRAIAEMIGADAVYLTSGAASAIVLSSAAAMAGDDDAKIQQLPDTTGMKNEFLIQKRQRYWYDRCLNLAGGKIVEFGTPEGTTEEQLEAAMGPKTAAVHYWMDERNIDPNVLTLQQVVKVAHRRNLPVTVDAAGQVYPVENLNKYAKSGADLVAYGTKYIGAPHSTGMIVGSREWVRKASLQSFTSFEARRVRGIGRPQKLDRQEIIGVVAAVRDWVTMDHESRLAKHEARSEAIQRHLKGLKGVKSEVVRSTIGTTPHGVRVEIDPAVTKKTLDDAVSELRAGDPPIWTRHFGGVMTVAVVQLADGQEEIVGQRLAEVLRAR
ncbi:MAG: aminotransferase class V-fold PLP-dependent enzyme [Chloroflexi bacterium]|nr:aminotransferase class V-fold PLP-dependent enzyme [Chloroflexota bacterium]